MSAVDRTERTGVAQRVWRWLTPGAPWEPGFVDLPRVARGVREAGAPEVTWALVVAAVVAFVGYVVAMAGVSRLNGHLSAWLPPFWLAVAIGLPFVGAPEALRPSLRASVVRNATLALMGLLSASLVRSMLTWRLFRLGHLGDNPTAPVGAALGCALFPVAPLLAGLALRALRRGGLRSHRALRRLAVASVVALGALVLGAFARHLRAPDVVSWLKRPPEVLRLPPFTRRPELWARLPPDGSEQVTYRASLLGLTVEAWALPMDRSECLARADFHARLDALTSPVFAFRCDDGIAFDHDRAAQLLIPPRDLWSCAFDYGRRRVVNGVDEVRRPLAPPPEWTLGGALGLCLAAGILLRARRHPEALDRASWRQGVRRAGEPEIVFEDGGPSLATRALPAGFVGPVVLPATTLRLGPGYRDRDDRDAPTVLGGTFEDVDAALRDRLDVERTRALAVAWTAGAPLAASWWVGLL